MYTSLHAPAYNNQTIALKVKEECWFLVGLEALEAFLHNRGSFDVKNIV